jgi:hypothetical protein
MRKIIVSQGLSLDGVMEDPCGWSIPSWHEEIAEE